MRANDNYVAGVRYALDHLHAIPNVYTYLDIVNHAWTGRDDVVVPVTELLVDTVRGSAAGRPSVDGFITNAADYAPLTEPYIAPNDNGSSQWGDGNRLNADLPFAPALRNRLIAAGFSPRIGMLIDTSRNGWGGPTRPTRPSNDPDLNIRVDQSRVDRRAHKGNRCNQVGAGLGERPRAVPAPGIDACVWAKPPGESDGSAMPSPGLGRHVSNRTAVTAFWPDTSRGHPHMPPIVRGVLCQRSPSVPMKDVRAGVSVSELCPGGSVMPRAGSAEVGRPRVGGW
jgi:cellulose 1,4-beta-cellobiosidase